MGPPKTTTDTIGGCEIVLLWWARRDSDGYLWVTGRVDDMLNVSGHLLSTAAVESALITHPDVAETAVVSTPHPVKGECLYCFITLKEVRW
ncbi:Acetyl-coenzyme A synthetase [Araneus ventricosus]|uniref:Acetyl-coenzyme A synthetase n=1 Tax=Araneus ventricosus TaxID=182803 RepID=A0A4Y2XB74_ARAVE|nr:Acetyl-coenzyme A synthetase [Araneus ventricosus]